MTTRNQPGKPMRTAPALLAVALAGVFTPALAYDFELEDGSKGRIGAILTLGTLLRTNSPDPALLGSLSTARVGQSNWQWIGNNGGNDLNFESGHAISTPAKALLDLDLSKKNVGALDNLGVYVRGRFWYDFALNDGDRPYGNYPNGFAQHVPLGDHGFADSAQFTGAQFLDGYAYGKYVFDDKSALDVRVGQQVVRWGVAQFLTGGIDIVNGIDIPASLRPGAILPDEARVPVPMVYANFADKAGWGLDGWYQWKFVPGVLPGCGTFFAPANYNPDGCNFANVLGGAGVNDPTALATGVFPHRGPDIDAKDSGQWGVSARYRVADINTEFRGYASNTHSRAAYLNITNANINGTYGTLNPAKLTDPTANTRLTDPNGLKYQMQYVEDIKMYGLSFDSTPRQGTRVYGEVSYRPSWPLGINASDEIAAFVNRSPLSALNLAKGVLALPPGATFQGYDKYPMYWTSLGASQVVPDVLGAERVVLQGEAGWNHISGLPSPGQLRYGRSDDYGVAQVTGGAPCVDRSPAQLQCQQEGFFTKDSWGYRLRITATYPNVYGATLTPVLLWAQDVRGNSQGTLFVEGRWIVRPALRAEYKQFFGEIAYLGTGGGTYNNLSDRSYASIYAGVKF
jgi:hypothetical protein